MRNDLSAIAKHWAIEPAALQSITAELEKTRAGLSFFSERPLAGTRRASIRDGVAVIPITGIITPRNDLFTILLGGTALDTLAQDIQVALDDDEVLAILLDVDSPGGVAIGQSEMADIIRRAGVQKPVWAYVGRHCCSAAYWLASAAQKILTHKSAMLGSIGIVSTIPVQESPDADGYRHLEIVSSNAKNKRPDPRTPEGIDTIRAELDALESEFIKNISTFRNMPEDKIKNDFGQGGVLLGAAAVSAGMADELSDYESAVSKLSDSTTINKKEGTMKKDEPAITPEQAQALRDEGAAAERKRLLALDEVAFAGHEDLLAKAKADPTMTAEKLALKIVQAEKSKGNGYLAGLKSAESAMPKVSPSKPKATTPVGATTKERAKNEWNAKPEIREEFAGDKDAFIAFFVANEKGQVKQLKNKGE